MIPSLTTPPKSEDIGTPEVKDFHMKVRISYSSFLSFSYGYFLESFFGIGDSPR